MQIKVLGCDGGVGPERRTTALLVGDRVLVDAGTGVCDLVPAAMDALTDVFLTHSHLDHVAGGAFLADVRLARGRPGLRLHAPAATLDALRTHLFNWVMWPDFTTLGCDEVPVLLPTPLAVGEAVAVAGLTVTAFPSLHTVPAVGYALSDAGGTFAFTGDTYGDPAMWRALNALPRLDKLMIEIAYGDAREETGSLSKHLTPARLARELASLKHRPELLLSHHKPGEEDAIVGQCADSLAGWHYRHLRRGDLITL